MRPDVRQAVEESKILELLQQIRGQEEAARRHLLLRVAKAVRVTQHNHL